MFPQPSVNKANEIVAGERYGIKVSIIAFWADAGVRIEKATMSELLYIIEERFGAPRVWQETIEGTDWVIIAVPGLSNRGNEKQVSPRS
jgi:hypothetical protein